LSGLSPGSRHGRGADAHTALTGEARSRIVKVIREAVTRQYLTTTLSIGTPEVRRSPTPAFTMPVAVEPREARSMPLRASLYLGLH
jgi:hypothetical protein